MRKRTLFLIFILCLFYANTSALTKYVTNNLNLRYEANTHSYILTVIPRGTAVTIDEDCNCKWVPVEYNGYVGYISTKYLSNTPVRKTYKHRIGTSVRKGRYSSYNRRGGLRYYTNSYGNRVQSPTYTTHDQQVQLLFVGMELIVSAKVGEEHARIMAEWQDGINIIYGLL